MLKNIGLNTVCVVLAVRKKKFYSLAHAHTYICSNAKVTNKRHCY